ncbi:MAG: hypothetical protein WCL44_08265 [bacterium]
MNRRAAALCGLSLGVAVFGGCASPMLKRSDYEPSLSALSSNAPEQALADFPTGEKGGFITSVEKAYLGLLAAKPEPTELLRHAAGIERRIRFDVSDELRHFFYAETEDGYYASEHEVIWLHLMLGWGYCLRGEYENAAIEARRSANLLTQQRGRDGHFDDPVLRIFLASIWTMCGMWDDAAVDFRAAAVMDESLVWARELGNMKQPPRHLAFVLGGIGPETYWNQRRTFNLMRGLRHVGFQFAGLRSSGYLVDREGRKIEAHLSPASAPWYERHWRRNNAINDLITDSRFFNRMLGSSSLMAARVGAGVGVGVGMCAVLVGGGAGIAYLGLLAESGELVALGVVVAIAGPFAGVSHASKTTTHAVDEFREDLDTSDRYRFVRFLPEYIWVAWSNDDLKYPLAFKTDNGVSRAINPISTSPSAVSITHFADVKTTLPCRPPETVPENQNTNTKSFSLYWLYSESGNSLLTSGTNSLMERAPECSE